MNTFCWTALNYAVWNLLDLADLAGEADLVDLAKAFSDSCQC